MQNVHTLYAHTNTTSTGIKQDELEVVVYRENCDLIDISTPMTGTSATRGILCFGSMGLGEKKVVKLYTNA